MATTTNAPPVPTKMTSIRRFVRIVELAAQNGPPSIEGVDLLRVLLCPSKSRQTHNSNPLTEKGKSKKKPVSNDPIIPKKEAFIKAKYAQLAFAIRPSKEDLLTVDELNKQRIEYEEYAPHETHDIHVAT
uniref:Uncharacterized protein n=1 Tax=Ditylenchus dipsaci TaxID=166011 RepID=A0A915E4Q4_9BILA